MIFVQTGSMKHPDARIYKCNHCGSQCTQESDVAYRARPPITSLAFHQTAEVALTQTQDNAGMPAL
jgi:hypothetical protein